MGKKPKDRQGRLTSPSGTSSLRLQFVLPRTPIYGGYPYPFPQDFRRAKYGSGYDPSRAAGPWCGAKFWPVPFYRRAWFRPAVAEGAGRGTPDEAVPKPGGMTGETSRNRGRAATEGRPYGVFRTSFGSGVTGAVSWLWWPSHRPGPKLPCRGGSPDPPANFPQQRLEPERLGAPFWSSCPGRLDFRATAVAVRLRGQSSSLPRLTAPQQPPELGPRKFRGSGDGATMGGDAHRSPPPAAFCLLCRRGQRRSPRRAKPCEASRPTGTGGSGTRPYGDPWPFPRHGGRGKPLPYGMKEGRSRNRGRASLGLACICQVKVDTKKRS